MMQPWFLEARLGIFLHWGIYSVGGVEASWSFYNHGKEGGGQMSYSDYMKLASGFTARAYKPRNWARLFRGMGARYAVLTAKHHDGVALWPTEAGPLSTVRMTPAQAFNGDLVGAFCEAMRAEGIRVGIYFSHADWSHPDYSAINKEGQGDAARWERFLAFYRKQLHELCSRYRPDLLWFDGEWERTAEQWRMGELKAQLEQWCPGVVLNGRLGGLGDYATPEQQLPLQPPGAGGKPFEYCATINHQWGYSPDNARLKPAHHLTRMMAETAALGGNLLLNIGPREDGTFDPVQEERLKTFGAWVRRNEEALFGTRPGLPAGYAYGPTTLSADRRIVYLCVLDRPESDVAVKGIRNPVRRARVVGTGEGLGFTVEGGASWARVPGTLWVEGPGEGDPLGTFVALELEGELDLWDGR